MNELYRGVGLWKGAPTLRSVRRLRNLERALKEISRRFVGADGIPYEAFIKPIEYARWNPTFLDFLSGLEPLEVIQDILVFGRGYIPDPVEPIRIKGRQVFLGTATNRLIERAVARQLAIYFEPQLSRSSGAFRPNRSAEYLVLKAREAVRGGAHYAFKTDVSKFFKSVNRVVLEQQLRDSLDDESLRGLILSAISPYRLDRPGEMVTQGLPQGNGLSPTLSNMYLHRLDVAFADFHYFRYADDILILCHKFDQVCDAFRNVVSLLRQLGLQISERKTIAADVYETPLVFLGYELRGGNIYPPQASIINLIRYLQFGSKEPGKHL